MKTTWTEERPWGRFLNVFEDAHCKIKIIEVDPEKRLSYQSHEKRRESWTIIQGEALVNLDGREVLLGKGDQIDIPVGAKHRLANKGRDLLKIVEVQTGSYFGEDDIRRHEDDWGRG